MIGVFAGWISLRWPEFWKRRRGLSAASGIIMLIALYASLWRWQEGHFVFAPDDYFARTFRFTLVSLGFALLLPSASIWKLKKESFASLAVRKIALWSYALYLVHIPILQLLMKYGYQDWRASLSHALILFVCEIGSAILLSALLFRFFERPCTGLRERVAPAVAEIFTPSPESSSQPNRPCK